jgi:hypothetical protein
MRCAALLAITGSLAAQCLAESGYVGAKVCSQCHATEFHAQSASGHAHALSVAASHPLAAQFVPREILKRKPGYLYRFFLSGNDFHVQVLDQTNAMTVPIDWAFGAGEQAVTFVSRIDRDWYVEHHFSYYRAMHGLGVTPGQQDRAAKNLPDAVGLVYKSLDPAEGIVRCFRCHSTGPVETASAAIRPTNPGVHCEACHGPGANHARTGDPKMIRNPKRMSAAALNRFCGVCHRPPAAAGVKIDWNFAWNVRHQPVYLSQSACFRKSDGALSCLSCHSPHQALNHDAGYYNRVCASCHPAAHLTQVNTMRNCIDCHMPRVSPQPPLRFTNHWIGVYGEGAKLKPVHAG